MRSIGRCGGWSRQTGVNEQGLPQVTNSELIADLEAILLELRHRLDNYLELGTRDLVAADEGFNFAGQARWLVAASSSTTASAAPSTGSSSSTRAGAK